MKRTFRSFVMWRNTNIPGMKGAERGFMFQCTQQRPSHRWSMEAGHSGLKSPIRCAKKLWIWKSQAASTNLRYLSLFSKYFICFSGNPAPWLPVSFVRTARHGKRRGVLRNLSFMTKRRGRERVFFWPVDDSAQYLPSFPYRLSQPPFLFWTCWSSLIGRVPCLGSQKRAL